jgi:hypothetical protein
VVKRDASAPAAEQADGTAKPSGAAPEPRRQATQSFEFRSEQWAEAYGKRIDEMIAALKSKGVPVIWVGLPSIRGARSTSDMIYLNDLFRARAERAGIVYVDVWDGFVDDSGRFATFGPDVEGQVRRLRSGEGVYFTQAGARKLAHYVDREITRVMGTRLTPMALPTHDEQGQPSTVPGQAARPAAGPVVSLTGTANATELLGGGAKSGNADPLAARVLVNGTAVMPPPGRADNFFLTPEAAEAAKAAAAAASPVPSAPAASASAPATQTATATPPSIATDELMGGPADTPDAGRKAAGAEPAPKPPTRNAAPPRPAARSAESRTQRANPPRVRPTTPRDYRNYRDDPRYAPRRPSFDPFAIFR